MEGRPRGQDERRDGEVVLVVFKVKDGSELFDFFKACDACCFMLEVDRVWVLLHGFLGLEQIVGFHEVIDMAVLREKTRF